jgi:hypothetical protein
MQRVTLGEEHGPHALRREEEVRILPSIRPCPRRKRPKLVRNTARPMHRACCRITHIQRGDITYKMPKRLLRGWRLGG